MPDLRESLRAVLDPEPDPVARPGDRLAAVLALLIEDPEPSLLFTERSKELRRHPGEVSFPGGLHEAGDVDLAHTALRETHEEIGLDGSAADMLGALPPVHTSVSGILVTPFVGAIRTLPTLGVSDGEIVRVLTVPIATLASREVERVYADRANARSSGGWTGYVYDVDDATIWGATGWMLHSFLDICRREAAWVL
jgi:CoA pyrophosphatase